MNCALPKLVSGSRCVGRGYFRLDRGPPPAEPYPQHNKSRKGADRVEQGIVRRSCTAGHERLVNFIHDGISCGAEKCRDAPRPAPPFSVAAHAAIKQQAKNKIFREVRALTDDVMDEFELVGGQRRIQPAQDRLEQRSGMLRRKRVCGHREDEACPYRDWPPGAHPSGHSRRLQARLNLWQLGSRARIAPRLEFRH